MFPHIWKMTEKEDDKIIGLTIRMLREQKGLLQTEFSLNCQKSRQQMHEWEVGKKSPSPYSLLIVVTELGMTRSKFFQIVESGEAKTYVPKSGRSKKNNSALL